MPKKCHWDSGSPFVSLVLFGLLKILQQGKSMQCRGWQHCLVTSGFVLGSEMETLMPLFGYQTIETMVPKEMEFPQESQAGERERPKTGGTCLPEGEFRQL